ncbi:hypothetical protein [Flavobacterium anhuiense]|uniref:hypothetical protein n=1 Tax=Flavobacterium anhuiense TaxID=459526 RepID=UPI0034D96786
MVCKLFSQGHNAKWRQFRTVGAIFYLDYYIKGCEAPSPDRSGNPSAPGFGAEDWSA